MPKPYDNVTRFLHSLDPRAWTNLLGIRAQTVEACDTGLSTVSSQADGLTLVDKQWALHLENQASYKSDMGDRLLEYNVLATKSLKVPVRSVVILLRPEADGPAMSGFVQRHLADGAQYLDFRFEVVRVWTIPADTFFEAGLGALPFSFVADVSPERLPSMVKRTKERLKRERSPKLVAEIWTAIDLMMGLRYSRTQIDDVLRGVQHMEESVTYQAILEKGVAKGVAKGLKKGRAEGLEEGLVREARLFLLKMGTQYLGKPSDSVQAKVNKISQKSRLEKLTMRTPLVSNWDELFK